MDKSRIKLMNLLYEAVNAMMDERAASFDEDEPETEETRRMQADVVLKRLYRYLREFYSRGPGG